MNLACAIVETNKHDDLFQVICNHLYHLPENTKLYFFGSKNTYYIKQLIDCEFIEVNVNSIDDYNNLLKSVSFWETFTEDRVLIFQRDSRLLRKGIEDFYEYDYIGASWHFAPFVGNGGLSLRNPKAMIDCLNKISITTNNEDIYFGFSIPLLGYKVAPIHIANKFSVETKFYLGSFGYHAIEKWLNKNECEQIKNQYGHN